MKTKVLFFKLNIINHFNLRLLENSVTPNLKEANFSSLNLGSKSAQISGTFKYFEHGCFEEAQK